MNAFLNYMLEANIGLLLFLAVYKVLLRRETNFRLLRIYLLTAIFVSLVFPLLHFGNDAGSSLLSVSQVIPAYWLPEVVIGESTEATAPAASLDFWKYTALIYWAGSGVFALLVLFQLARLFNIIRQAKTYRLNRLHIAESTADKPIFSFFNFIFIGKVDELSPEEKQQVIQHESAHAAQWHSFDILVINLLRVAFWFNPFINRYKKIFIQLHEFEADARAVENSDLNRYCTLLAKVALKSAGFTLANHFNNSLTIKRIEMMRTKKIRMKTWKLAALGLILPLVFVFIACQDQVMDDVQTIAESSVVILDTPPEVQQKLDELKAANPEKKYVLLEPTGEGQTKLDEMVAQQTDRAFISSIHVVKLGPTAARKVDNGRSFVIVEYNEQARQLSEATKTEDNIYTVVEEQPEFPGGYDAMITFIRENMRYPAEARQQGIEGTVYVSFIVAADGTVYDTKVVRGLMASTDNEAKRVVDAFPNWIPGKQSGKPVSVRFVLPIKFKL